VILAVRFNKAKEPELDLTIENLMKVKANVLGVVMTAFDHKKSSGYYYTSYNYKYAHDSYYTYHDKTTLASLFKTPKPSSSRGNCNSPNNSAWVRRSSA